MIHVTENSSLSAHTQPPEDSFPKFIAINVLRIKATHAWGKLKNWHEKKLDGSGWISEGHHLLEAPSTHTQTSNSTALRRVWVSVACSQKANRAVTSREHCWGGVRGVRGVHHMSSAVISSWPFQTAQSTRLAYLLTVIKRLD